ncbi:DUF2726 domain-containing protein [Actinoplanes sp. NPDC049802]|uniref:DUF2726 domain-containing protein n=1 Tax=Actinoplanes sp. NPDC049802 TaxID=3154742 RepID=UPI0033DB67AF
MDEKRRLRPVLVNRYEKVTDQLLTEVAAEHGDRLLTKVRVADVMNVDSLTGVAKHYGLSAHYDFVMIQAETSMPKFAVELDGAQHWTDPATRRRDQLKDQLSEWAELPLLRITSDFTQQRGRWSVLTYVVDAFYLSEGFLAAQEAGTVPWDEPFDAASFLRRGDDGRLGFNTLDHEPRLQLLRMYEAGKIPFFAPDEWHTTAVESRGVQTHAWMAVDSSRYLVSRVRVRDFLFQGMSPSELSSQLAVAEFADLARRWLTGEPVACDQRRLARYMAEVQEAIDAGGFRGSGTGGAMRASGPLPSTINVRMSHLRHPPSPSQEPL